MVSTLALGGVFAAVAAADEPGGAGEPLHFDIDDGVGLALQSLPVGGSSNLVVITEGGSFEDAVDSGAATFDRFLIAPDDRVFILFKQRVDLSDTSVLSPDGCLLAEVDPETGTPTCVDDSLSTVYWNEQSSVNPAIQFDGSGGIYYLGQTDGGTVLRKKKNGVTTDLISDNISVQDFLVMPDGTVFLSGSTMSTGARWVRRISPQGALQTIRATSAHFLRTFADGNVYMGLSGGQDFGVLRYLTAENQLDPLNWIGSSVNNLNPPSHFWADDFCGPNWGLREGFCGMSGATIKKAFGGYVIAGWEGDANGTFAQYYPELRFPDTAVRKVSVAVGARDAIILAGLDANDRNVLTAFRPADGSETQLIGPDNEIEVFHLNYLADQNKLVFDGLRFADNRYVLGEIDLGGVLGPASAPSAARYATYQSVNATIKPTGQAKWVDFQTFGAEVTPPPMPRQESPRNEQTRVESAKLRITKAEIRNGRFNLAGALDRAAAGSRVTVRFTARNRQIALRPPVRRNGQFSATLKLRGAQSLARTGRVQVFYRGSKTLRPATENLLVGRRPVDLSMGATRLPGKRLEVRGVSRLGFPGAVRILIEYPRPDGKMGELKRQVRIGRNGRFTLRLATPAAAGPGAWVSVTFPGRGQYSGRRIGRSLVL